MAGKRLLVPFVFGFAVLLALVLSDHWAAGSGTDTDGDSWSDAAEAYLGTDWLDNCPDNALDPAWPLDQDNNGGIFLSDVTKYTGKFSTPVSGCPGGADCRLDLDTSGVIGVGDLFYYTGMMYASCDGGTPAPHPHGTPASLPAIAKVGIDMDGTGNALPSAAGPGAQGTRDRCISKASTDPNFTIDIYADSIPLDREAIGYNYRLNWAPDNINVVDPLTHGMLTYGYYDDTGGSANLNPGHANTVAGGLSPAAASPWSAMGELSTWGEQSWEGSQVVTRVTLDINAAGPKLVNLWLSGTEVEDDDVTVAPITSLDEVTLAIDTPCPPPDRDGDTIPDAQDNCPDDFNPGQGNIDGDGLGDVCDENMDGDPYLNSDDNCPTVPNPSQTDTDNDGEGDPCDDTPGNPDTDGDTVPDGQDNCPAVPNGPAEAGIPGVGNQTDTDGDGLGDACEVDPQDPDTDDDGVFDSIDNCVSVYNADQIDIDSDDVGDACDPDMDGDTVLNTPDNDNCPRVANPGQEDVNPPNGVGDACEPGPGGTDSDNDDVRDTVDNCPSVYNPFQRDVDGDGLGDACDPDLDGDNVGNGTDKCLSIPNFGQFDQDGDGLGDSCDPFPSDPDSDGDGLSDSTDNCRLVYNSYQADLDTDGRGDVCDADDDGDGFLNDKEYGSGSDALNPAKTPEVCDDAGQDEDVDTLVNEGYDYEGSPIPDCTEPGLDSDGDTIVNLTDTDDDNDGFLDEAENWMATDSLRKCVSDGWPLDQNNDGYILIGDVTMYTGKLFAGPGNPEWNRRLDMNKDGYILIGDVTLYTGRLFETCT